MPHKCVARKVAAIENRLFGLDVNKGYLHGNVFSRCMDLVYVRHGSYWGRSLQDKLRDV